MKTTLDLPDELLIQAKKAAAEQRRPLRAIVERAGGERMIRQKIDVVEGDIADPLCGISAEHLEKLHGKVDIVVNLAGVVVADDSWKLELVSDRDRAMVLVESAPHE